MTCSDCNDSVCKGCGRCHYPPWIDVEKRKPPNSAYVIVAKYDPRTNMKTHCVTTGFLRNKKWFHGEDKIEVDPQYAFITHWMPLPDTPIFSLPSR